MKLTAIIISLLLVGCGAGEPSINNLPSTQPTMSCDQSAECVQRTQAGEVLKTCDEQYHGGRMMSTWDNGRSWLVGNCDLTAN